LEERRDTLVAWRGLGRGLLPYLVAIVTRVCSRVIAGLPRAARWVMWSGGNKVVVDWLNRLECKGVSSFGAVEDHWLPDVKPVLNVSGSGVSNPQVEIGGVVSDKEVSVGCEDVVALLMKVV
jgi:hypothetical protein